VLVGHYSAAFLAKAAEPRVPLWALAVAAQLLDVVWALLVLLGVEHLRLDPSLPSNPLDLYDMPWTHSLAAAVVWSVLAGALASRWLASARAGAVVAATVASHWVFDWLVHRPDLPLWPGSAKLGLGLWDHPAWALALELSLLLGSAWLCARRMSAPAGRGIARLVAALAGIQLALTIGPPPVGAGAVPVIALVLFGVVVWACARIESGRKTAG
jgi:hypothetical protein